MSKAFEQFAKSAGGPIGVGIAVLGVAGTIYFLFGDKVKDALKSVGQAVNPTSDKNLAYTGVNAVGAAISGDTDWSLGGWIYDITHSDEQKKIAETFRPRSVQVREEATWYERLLGH